MKKICLLIFLFFLLPATWANNVEMSIAKLKHFILNQENSIQWREHFSAFLTREILESNNNIVVKVCQMRSRHYNECMTSPLGFYNTALGTRNTLDSLINECQENNLEICSTYERMLNQNLNQLKYILKLN